MILDASCPESLSVEEDGQVAGDIFFGYQLLEFSRGAPARNGVTQPYQKAANSFPPPPPYR